MFMEAWCAKCIRDKAHRESDGAEGGCRIIVYTMALPVDDPDYPKAWVYDAEGAPTCTEFLEDKGQAFRDEAVVKQVQDRYDSLPRDPKTGRPVIA